MVKAERIRRIAQSQADCSNPDVARPRCQAERARAFAQARNAEINASIAAVEAERRREFAAARNAEINASIAAVKAERIRMLAQSQADCRNPIVTRPRCQAERAREFARARNAESNASMAAVTAERTRAFAAARNAEINASITAVKAERTRAFTAARNAEIDAAIAASQAQRALRLALEQARQSRMETGAISLPETLGPAPAPLARRTRAIGPCLEAGRLMNPLQFSDGNAEIEPAMKPELDHIAMMAQHCPAVRFEIHGHSDNAAPSQVNRHLAQRRAQAAVEYLVGAGVDRSRIAAIGHADAQPLVPNTSEQNRALNRRIEVTINDPATQAAAQRVMWDLAELLDPTYVPPLARLSP
jgi:outer membrane protein OmpA-like peptidoglycan-associated protein